MNEDSAYTVFFFFGLIWVIMGVAAVVALLRSEKQPLRFGIWGILVALPIVVGIIAALVISVLV